MAQRKPYNPNTKYGRRKRREEAELYRQSLSPAERKNFDNSSALIMIIIIAVVLLFVYLAGGTHGVIKYLQR